MEKVRFLIESFGRKALLVILASDLLLTAVLSGTAWPQVDEPDKQKVIQQVAVDWILVGMEQCRRGFYEQAEKSFLQAREYQEYLSSAEREKLSERLQKTHIAMLERKRILEIIGTVKELVEQGQLVSAKVHLGEIQGSVFLTKKEQGLIREEIRRIDDKLDELKEERKPITEELKKVDERLDERESEVAEIYSRSVEFYLAGQFEKAREGFVKIDELLARGGKPLAPFEAEPAEKSLEAAVAALQDELLDVGSEAVRKAGPEAAPVEPVADKPSWHVWVGAPEPKAPEPITDEIASVEAANRRRNILRSYTKAVVKDAVAKAQNYISEGEFDKAKKAIERAEQTVNKNQLYLGSSLFRQYSSELKQLAKKIAQVQDERSQ